MLFRGFVGLAVYDDISGSMGGPNKDEIGGASRALRGDLLQSPRSLAAMGRYTATCLMGSISGQTTPGSKQREVDDSTPRCCSRHDPGES